MLARHFAHSRITDCAPQVSKPDIAPPISLLGQRQDSVRSDMNMAAKTSSEMHTEKGIARVWDRIHETPDEVSVFRCDLVVLPSEGDDLRVRQTRQPSEQEAMTGVRRRRQDGQSLVRAHRWRREPWPARTWISMTGCPRIDLAARLNNIGGELFGNDAEVDDRRSRDQQRRESPNMRLAVTKLCSVDHARSGNTVGLGTIGQLEQTG